MLRTVQGTYRNGEISLQEMPGDVADGTLVLVTFLTPQTTDLVDYGIDPQAAADLRARLSTFAADWDAPEMDVYDDYDATRDRLQAR